MKLSTKTRYGLRAVVEIGLNNGKPVLLKDIAKRINVSMKYLDHIFASLKKAGIIRSLKGHGGYVLGKNSEEITALDIVEVLEGKISFVECTTSNVCLEIGSCVANELWKKLNEKAKDILRVSLKKLILRQKTLNSKKTRNYYI